VIHVHNGILYSNEKCETLSSVTVWMEVEITILSEINLAQKDKYSMISLICGT
jgi:hypothetical protein